MHSYLGGSMHCRFRTDSNVGLRYYNMPDILTRRYNTDNIIWVRRHDSSTCREESLLEANSDRHTVAQCEHRRIGATSEMVVRQVDWLVLLLCAIGFLQVGSQSTSPSVIIPSPGTYIPQIIFHQTRTECFECTYCSSWSYQFLFC